MSDYVECECGENSIVGGHYPDFFAWCFCCENYVQNFDSDRYCADFVAEQIEKIHCQVSRIKKEGITNETISG